VGAALPWDWARGRLESAADYWLTTVDRSARPSTRPVWGIWSERRLLLSVGSTTHWRNLDANPNVGVTLGDAGEVVILEGTAAVEDDHDALRRFIDAYNPKYGWNFTLETVGGVVAITPTVVLGWLTGPVDVDAQDDFPIASSRWVF
jgi:hypothetical protein